jgi:uncharacterized membrane protein
MEIKIFITTLIIILIIDIIWLGFISPRIYKSEIGNLMKEKPNWYGGFLVYIILAFAITIFVIKSGIAPSPKDALIYGAILGFVIYGVYDLTNYSTLKDWTIKITIIDLLWGTFLGGLVSYLVKLILK